MSMPPYPHRTLRALTTLISSGSTPLGGQSVYQEDGPVMLVRSQNVQMNRLDVSDVAYISNEIDSQMQRSVVKNNDVLLNITGASIGRVARFTLKDTRANVNQHVCIIRTKPDELTPQYLEYFLSSPQVQNDINNRYQHGGTRQALTFAQISEFEIPLPPLSEQKRIADILDKADSIRRKRQEALNEIETLSLSSYRHQFGHPIAASDSLPLGECVTMLSGGTPSKSNDAYWNGDFPWVSPKDMKVDYISFAEDHVTDLAFQETTLKKLPAEAILIVVRGMILAHTIPVALTDVPVAINQDMKALIANDGYDPHFLCWSLKAAHNYILGKVATAAHGTKRLEVEHLASFPIPRVTVSEQRQFARIVQKIRDSRDRLATGVPEDLFNSLVQRAFKGEL